MSTFRLSQGRCEESIVVREEVKGILWEGDSGRGFKDGFVCVLEL